MFKMYICNRLYKSFSLIKEGDTLWLRASPSRLKAKIVSIFSSVLFNYFISGNFK